MKNDDNACIRYLMKEMDPSEELLMERAMMEDDDLLIEVESLRQTLKRLDELPDVEPPAHVRRSVMQEADEAARRRKKSSILSFKPVKYAAAAIIFLGFSVGGYLMYQQEEASGTDRATLSSGINNTPPVSRAKAQKTDPWVDRQDVIHFDERFQNANSDFDSILKSSTDKLTPLSDPFNQNTRSRSLQMTGTGN